MIKLVENEGERLCEFCARDAFGTKLVGYYKTFGTDFPFALFWIQLSGERVTAAVCRIYGSTVVCASDETDFTELSQFLSAVGFSVLSCSLPVCRKLGFEPVRQGNIVEFKAPAKRAEGTAELPRYPELPPLYDLLVSSGFKNLGERGEWMADISARMRCGVAQWCVAKHDGSLAACACALFITDEAAFMGCVAADPAHRGEGLGTEVVLTLANELCVKRRVNLFCKDGEIVNFYKKLGFEVVGRWAECEYIG